MIGRNPLWVAKQHGHSLLTMLRVYAAWTADAAETDAAAIREAMGYIDRVPAPPADGGLRARLAVDLPLAGGRIEVSTGKDDKIDGGEGGIRTHVPVLPDHPISSRRRYDRFGTSPARPKLPNRRIMVNGRATGTQALGAGILAQAFEASGDLH